ncbi:hypothetical protein Tsubulata_000269 [Turnera subulata]|uniref:Pentatricopeptide repeat-containing protein n=1 Tax=Turnera subulata TaxID=218843 RepID=A0A9Q0FYB8_9ROSI|nr:hypothetical protein Tsubulata_000269 [Turnera subulata]
MEMPSPSSPTTSSSLADSYSHLLRTSTQFNNLYAGKSIHAHIIKLRLSFNVYLMNNLINFYAKTGSPADAHHVFDEMPVKTTFSWNTLLSGYAKQGNIEKAHCLLRKIPDRDSVSWTTMIVGYNRMGCFDDAVNVFVQMVRDTVLPTQFTLTNILASTAAIRSLSIGRKVHSFVVKLGLGRCIPVANSLLNMYVKTGDVGTAKVVFNRMRVRDTSSWNVMISLHMLAGRVDLARSQFEQMSGRDIVTWNSMISGCTQHGFDEEALKFFSSMLKDSSLKPDRFTLASALSASANLGNLNSGKQVHGYIVRTDFSTSGAVGNALISINPDVKDLSCIERQDAPIDNAILSSPFTAEEVRIALFQMNPHKSLEPDVDEYDCEKGLNEDMYNIEVEVCETGEKEKIHDNENCENCIDEEKDVVDKSFVDDNSVVKSLVRDNSVVKDEDFTVGDDNMCLENKDCELVELKRMDRVDKLADNASANESGKMRSKVKKRKLETFGNSCMHGNGRCKNFNLNPDVMRCRQDVMKSCGAYLFQNTYADKALKKFKKKACY